MNLSFDISDEPKEPNKSSRAKRPMTITKAADDSAIIELPLDLSMPSENKPLDFSQKTFAKKEMEYWMNNQHWLRYIVKRIRNSTLNLHCETNRYFDNE